MAFGSASETEYILLLSFELGYLTKGDYEAIDPLIQEVKKMLSKLIITIRK
ncbi:four helix bundle protein [Pedobacter changchengzhani]|uniref:Four helix bundle protein n=1 Tax=Pedobacter changchengzhani TaxID=2529274 RepID=A0A4V3A0L7_9SPHI|nr:four helix bundle protein [Pedobacter changchengzhani]